MNSGIDSKIRTVTATPSGERVVSSLSHPGQPSQAFTKSGVMDTLLGKNNLAAFDASGSDPYNATGQHFRR